MRFCAHPPRPLQAQVGISYEWFGYLACVLYGLFWGGSSDGSHHLLAQHLMNNFCLARWPRPDHPTRCLPYLTLPGIALQLVAIVELEVAPARDAVAV